MVNSRNKGCRFEREFANNIKHIFPEARRNIDQSYKGGCDIINTPGFSFELKTGPSYKSKMISKILTQLINEATPETIRVGVVKVNSKEIYGLVPFEDLIKLIANYAKNK